MKLFTLFFSPYSIPTVVDDAQMGLGPAERRKPVSSVNSQTEGAICLVSNNGI
jgi:hypothetical protein